MTLDGAGTVASLVSAPFILYGIVGLIRHLTRHRRGATFTEHYTWPRIEAEQPPPPSPVLASLATGAVLNALGTVLRVIG